MDLVEKFIFYSYIMYFNVAGREGGGGQLYFVHIMDSRNFV